MKKKVLLFLLLIAMGIGVCGCMNNQNNEVKMDSMKNYASEKYGRDFTVEYFQEARDATYTNILTLSDGDVLFNVYQSGDAEAADDYAKVIVNQKLKAYLEETCDVGLDIYTYFMVDGANSITYEYARESDAETILSDYSLLKVIAVVSLNGEISDSRDTLYTVYKNIMMLTPKYIDFEMIQVEGMSFELEKMLKNLPGLYDKAWNKYPEIKNYIGIADTDICSAMELVKGGN